MLTVQTFSRVLAIDPGNERSAFVLYDGARIEAKGILENADLLARIADFVQDGTVCAVEMIASYGMAVGAEVFDTCVWIGRFIERWESLTKGREADLVVRRIVKMHLCGANNAKDSNLRAAL